MPGTAVLGWRRWWQHLFCRALHWLAQPVQYSGILYQVPGINQQPVYGFSQHAVAANFTHFRLSSHHNTRETCMGMGWKRETRTRPSCATSSSLSPPSLGYSIYCFVRFSVVWDGAFWDIRSFLYFSIHWCSQPVSVYCQYTVLTVNTVRSTQPFFWGMTYTNLYLYTWYICHD